MAGDLLVLQAMKERYYAALKVSESYYECQ